MSRSPSGRLPAESFVLTTASVAREKTQTITKSRRQVVKNIGQAGHSSKTRIPSARAEGRQLAKRGEERYEKKSRRKGDRIVCRVLAFYGCLPLKKSRRLPKKAQQSCLPTKTFSILSGDRLRAVLVRTEWPPPNRMPLPAAEHRPLRRVRRELRRRLETAA